MGIGAPTRHLRCARRSVAVCNNEYMEQMCAHKKSPEPEPGAKVSSLGGLKSWRSQVLEVSKSWRFAQSLGVSSRERCLLVSFHSDRCAHLWCPPKHALVSPRINSATGSSCRACRCPHSRNRAWRRDQQECHQRCYRTDNPTFHVFASPSWVRAADQR